MSVLSSWQHSAGGTGGNLSELYTLLLQLPPGTQTQMPLLPPLHVTLIKPLCCVKSPYTPVHTPCHIGTHAVIHAVVLMKTIVLRNFISVHTLCVQYLVSENICI